MSFTCFDHFAETIEMCPSEEMQGKLALAILKYGIYGEEPELEWPLDSIFHALRNDIDNSVTARSKNKGGRPKKDEEAENNAPKTQKTGVSENKNGGFERKKPRFSEIENGGFENEKPNINQANIGQSKLNQAKPIQPKTDQEGERARADAQAGDDDARFIADALDIFNAETGLDVRDLTPEAMLGLQRIRGSGRTLDDVRRVVRAKREQWGGDQRMRRYLRPSTLFGEKFEEYLAESRKVVMTYAEYD